MDQQALQVGRKPRKERTRLPEDALTHSVNHWIRVEAFAILHEGEFTTKEVAEKIGEDVKYVSGHMKDLFESGCIERAGFKVVGGRISAVYRAVILPAVDREEYKAMSIEDRHDLTGAVIQSIHAESVSSYRNKKMDTDENLCLIWEPMALDALGKQELLEHQIASWQKAKEIGNRSASRMTKSGESGTYSIVAFLGFERGRSGTPLGGYFRPERKEQ